MTVRPACGAQGQTPCAATARVVLDPVLKPGRYQVRAFESWPAGEFAIKGRADFEVR